ncbi:MAG: hypothetical protein MJ239_07170, partial [Bacilli bacterium]|nr:hypothetical protein [Bacilli bacterium]
MSWDFSLANFDTVWKSLLIIGILLISLLLGNILRATIPFLKKALVPSALLGGLIFLGIKMIIQVIDKEGQIINDSFNQILQVITYHGLGIGFIAMTFRTVKAKNKVPVMKAIENGALTGGTYMLQGIVGVAITVIFYLCTKETSNMVFYGSGLLLPLSYGQGPGNALTWDVNFSKLVDDLGQPLWTGNGSFGLSLASIGFLVSSIFGILFINIQKRKGIVKVSEEKTVNRGVDVFESPNEIPDNESVDKFSIQIALVALAYALAFGIMCGFAAISDFTGGIAWGFNFIWGVITANLIKLIMNFLKKKKIMKKEHINNYQMDRISGFAFDLMIVAGVAAIQIKDVAKYIWPLIALAAAGAVFTYLYILLVTKHCFKGYESEMFVTNFGALTGTASNGMILLREVDPGLTSPASSVYVISQLPAMVFVAPMLLLLNFAAKSFTNTIITLGIFSALFIGYTLFLFRTAIFKKKAKEEPQA